MGDKLIMSQKERQRKAILEQIKSGCLTRADAAKRLHISPRQLRRIIKRYRQFGDKGLIHQSRGQKSNSARCEVEKNAILSAYEAHYMGFGPTLASEKLKERQGLIVHPETLRLWLKAAGLWEKRRVRKKHRQRRARRPRYGELLQLDGSIHQWFQGQENKSCLMNLVDDATGRTLAIMDYGETLRAALSLLKWWIQEAGIPLAVYVDLKSVYVSPKSLKQKEAQGEELVESEWLTHFSRACKRLGIEVIKAYSPQAKGRVERSHAVYQDRFVKELALQGIDTLQGANELLSGGFINQLNDKFAKAPESDEDAHVDILDVNLDDILCLEFTRQVKNDWTIQFKNQVYQIEKSNTLKVPVKQSILVREHLDGTISLWYKEQKLPFKRIEKSVKKETENKAQEPMKITGKNPAYRYSPTQRSEQARKNKHKTPWGRPSIPWSQCESNPQKGIATR